MQVHTKQRLRDDKVMLIAQKKNLERQVKGLTVALEEISTKTNPVEQKQIALIALGKQY